MHCRITVRRGSYDLDCTDESTGLANRNCCGFPKITYDGMCYLKEWN
jgi:hypothetical protein